MCRTLSQTIYISIQIFSRFGLKSWTTLFNTMLALALQSLQNFFFSFTFNSLCWHMMVQIMYLDLHLCILIYFFCNSNAIKLQMIWTKVTRGTNWNRQLTLWKVVATRITYLCFWCYGWCSLVCSKVAAVVNYGWLLLKQGTYMSNCKILHPKHYIFECLNFFCLFL